MVTINRAKPNECQKIKKFEEIVWKEKGITSPYDSAYFISFGYAYVAKDNGKIVGIIIAIQTRDDKIKVIDWLVHQKYRHQGIGTRLYRKLLKETGNLPVLAFVNSANAVSLERHVALGFKKIKKIRDPFYLGNKKYWLVANEKNKITIP